MAEQAQQREKNGLPRVAWTFKSWKEAPKARDFRLVLVESTAYDDRHLLHWSDSTGTGVQVVLEVLDGQDSMGQPRWHEIREADSPDLLDVVWALARQVLMFDGPHCEGCGDTGVLPSGREANPSDTCANSGCRKLRRFHGPHGEAGECRFVEGVGEALSSPCAKCERGAQVAKHQQGREAAA